MYDATRNLMKGLTLALALTFVACDKDVTCDDISCDSSAEFCVYFGSDTDEPGNAECHDLPDSCLTTRECACLEGEDVGNFGLPWCLDEGSCETVDEMIRVVCPSG